VKIQFDTPLTGTDQNGNTVTLTAAQIAALSYVVLLDTVNPPVKRYPVPAANISNSVANTNGSRHVTVTDADLQVTIVPDTPYFLEIQDALGNAVSTTAVLNYENVITPGPVQNPTVS